MRRLAQILAVVALMIAMAAGSARAAPDLPIAYLVRTGGYWQVWVMAPDGSGARQVSTSAYEKVTCSWFPDGRALLVNALDGTLHRLELADGRETPLEIPLPGTNDAVLSPDGAQIAFSLSPTSGRDNNEIWLVDLDGENLRRLTRMKWLQHLPRWSRDGAWIYFLSGDGVQDHDIFRIALASGSMHQLTAGKGYHFEVVPGPEPWIAFSNDRDGNYELYVQEGSGPARRLTQHPALDGHPAWSPDGEELVFDSDRSGVQNLWRVARDGGEPVQLTRHAKGARAPVWWLPREAPSPGAESP